MQTQAAASMDDQNIDEEQQPLAILSVEHNRTEMGPSFERLISEKVKKYHHRDSSLALASVANEETPLSKVSMWALNQIEALSHFLRVSFEVEKQAWELFEALERELLESGQQRKAVRVHREVKNLKIVVNYDISGSTTGKKGERRQWGSR